MYKKDITNKNKAEDYPAIGLCLGLSLGLAVGQLFFHNSLACMSIGMCIGLAAGEFISLKRA